MENGKLPILVKFIDAKKDLFVQVHLDDKYARKYEHQNGKTEMWYVIDADDSACLIYGFRHKVTEAILRNAVKTGTLDKYLQKSRYIREKCFMSRQVQFMVLEQEY